MEKKEKSRVNILGYSKSRIEVFINGIAFLAIQVTYEIFHIHNQMPMGWSEKNYEDLERPILIPTIFFIIAYLLTDHAIFGGEGEGGREKRVNYLAEKHGKGKVLLWKLSLTIAIIFVSLFFPIYLTKLFF